MRRTGGGEVKTGGGVERRYFSGDQVSILVYELILRHRLPGEVPGLLTLRWRGEL